MTVERALGGLVAAFAIGLVVAWLAGPVHGARAQGSRSSDVAIAPGPGGMWVLQGDSVRVCIGGAVQTGVAPPAPRCGDATPLR